MMRVVAARSPVLSTNTPMAFVALQNSRPVAYSSVIASPVARQLDTIEDFTFPIGHKCGMSVEFEQSAAVGGLCTHLTPDGYRRTMASSVSIRSHSLSTQSQ